MEWGKGGGREAQSREWAGQQGCPETSANRHPPVEPTLPHRGAGVRGLAATLPPRLRVSPPPPRFHPPHHREVSRPWAAVGV